VNNLVAIKTRLQLLLNDHFYGHGLTDIELVPNDTIETACTNGIVIKYNPDWFASQTPGVKKTILAHEWLHIAFKTNLRRGSRNPERWNIATDKIINYILRSEGFEFPIDGNYACGTVDQSAEKYYSEAEQKSKKQQTGKQQGQGQGQGQTGQSSSIGQQNAKNDNASQQAGKAKQGEFDSLGGVEDFNGTEEEKQAQSDKITGKIFQAAAAARNAGKCPGWVQRLVESERDPKIDWRSVLRESVVSALDKRDYTFSKPNLRYSGTGFILPSLQGETIEKVVCSVDMSGSVTDEDLQAVTDELNGILSEFNISDGIQVDSFDTEIRDSKTFDTTPIKLECTAGGGTSYRDIFKTSCNIQLVFTDGECSRFPATAPDWSVVWVLCGYVWDGFNPPFGTVVRVEP
jgi:predicted metal-dependent peptidase